MNQAVPKRRKSRIASRVRTINISLLFLVLALMAVVAAMIISDISDDNASNIARSSSLEAAQAFYSYVSEDITLVRKASYSSAISAWCADEGNGEKKALAFNEMMDYTAVVPEAHLYLGINRTFNHYTIVGKETLENFVPITKLDPVLYDDAWFFESAGSESEFVLNIGIDRTFDRRFLWINHKVIFADKLVGIFSSGLRVPDVFHRIFDQFDPNTLKGYIIDSHGVIKLAGGAGNMHSKELESHIRDRTNDPLFISVFDEYIASDDVFFGPYTQPVVAKLGRGDYVSIAPVAGLDWSVIVFYKASVFSTIESFLPLLIVMMASLFLYVAGRNFMVRRLIFSPLGRLTQSISGGGGGDIFGIDRDDEIGELARTIQEASRERQIQALQLSQAQQKTKALLDAMPMTIQLWNKSVKMFDCSEEAFKLFKTKSKQEFCDRFFDLSPKYQSDGQVSSMKAVMYLHRAFADGKCNFEWMHQTLDGMPLPSEVTLVRVRFGDEDVVASYVRDLRQYKKMMKQIETRDHLLNTVNNAATILIQSDIDEFRNDLQRCMGVMGEAVGVDRVCIWKNNFRNNRMYCTQLYEWLGGGEAQMGGERAINIPYDENIPDWLEILSQGKSINKIVNNMTLKEQAELKPRGTLSIFVSPVFVRGLLWGFVSYDDCHHERVFTEDEELILSSGSLMITNALLRNDMAMSIRDGADKLHAVIENYQGIIWCVDRNNEITLFDGQYLSNFGLTPELVEGKRLDEALNVNHFSDLISSVDKTFATGPQDFNSEVNGRIFRIRTTPIYEKNGLIGSVVGSFDDITERYQLQKELKAALEEAQAASQAKTSFLANMSHEMRTPLNAVIGLSEMIMDTGGFNEDTSLNLQKIYNAGLTLLSTVNDILDISKIEAGKLELLTAEYDTCSLINDAINQSIMRIGDKPIKFVLDIDEHFPARLYGDDIRIKQILNNLLSNAFKYTTEGEVKLSVSCEEIAKVIWMIIRVSDNGMGIKSEDMDSLFSDYAQLDKNQHRRIEGTGLGLPITKRIAELMGGSISVESEYGVGSVFTVTVKQQFVNDEVIGPEVAKTLKEFRYSEKKRNENLRRSRILLPYAKVLLVDDILINLDVAKGMMKPYGMQVDCVRSGQEAVDAVREEKVRYNAIFMDHMMPGMDGMEAVRIIREEIGTEYAKTVPIIALTANAIVGTEEKFLSKGFQAFISKPIELQHLDSVIREWVRDEELEKELGQVSVGGEMILDSRSGQDRRQHTYNRRSGVDRREMKKLLPGLEMSKGIARFGGDKKLYFQVLHSYQGNTQPLLDSMKGVTGENLKDYAITVHGVKGSSRGINADEIADKAEALEKAAKEGSFDFIEANNGVFIEETERFLVSLGEFLQSDPSKSERPKKDKPDKDALARLLSACEAYNMDEADAAMKDIEAYEYNSDDGLSLWLKDNLERMNFTEIKDKLVSLG